MTQLSIVLIEGCLPLHVFMLAIGRRALSSRAVEILAASSMFRCWGIDRVVRTLDGLTRVRHGAVGGFDASVNVLLGLLILERMKKVRTPSRSSLDAGEQDVGKMVAERSDGPASDSVRSRRRGKGLHFSVYHQPGRENSMRFDNGAELFA